LIVVDASALVALGEREPDAGPIMEALARRDAVISGVNYVEAGLILIGGGKLSAQPDFDRWLEKLSVTVHADDGLARAALAAYLQFGKGIHPARLNLGDVFAYALAKTLNAPLLFKGGDFALTDISAAV